MLRQFVQPAAAQLESGLAEDIENGAVDMRWDSKSVSSFFQSKYEWDALAARCAVLFFAEWQYFGILVKLARAYHADPCGRLGQTIEGQMFLWTTRCPVR
jgi:hypothetical protein